MQTALILCLWPFGVKLKEEKKKRDREIFEWTDKIAQEKKEDNLSDQFSQEPYRMEQHNLQHLMTQIVINKWIS